MSYRCDKITILFCFRWENGKKKEQQCCAALGGDPLGARTQDPNIKSVVLYLLS